MAVRHNIVEQYLDAIARGEQHSISQLLPSLSNEILYVPVLNSRNIEDDRGTNKIKIASFISGQRRVVPVFTSEDIFLGWLDGSRQCLPVAGGDLALTLPRETWVVLNPGEVHALELSPGDLNALAQILPEITSPIPSRETPAEEAEQKQVDEVTSSVPDDSPSGFTAEDVSQITVPQPYTRPQSYEDTQRLLEELLQILVLFPEVREGYFQEVGEQAVLGLLTYELETEQRFVLIDQIAELSRRFYGTAGAIEVYDDLELSTSRSWELFNTITPFYTQGAEGSSLHVEVERVSSGKPPLLKRIRRTGMRIIAALRPT